jgi:hypothetical protein
VTANDSTATPATNAAAAQGIQWPGLGGSQHAAIYGGYAGAAQIALAVGTSNSLSDVATFSATGMTVNSNAIVGGTLGVTGNATFSGTANLAPSQTASSGASLMTRDLDTRMVDYIMHAPNRFRNLAHAIASHISGTGTAVHAGPITEGRINVRIINGSTNSFASVRVNRQGPWNGTEGSFGINWSRPMSLAVMGSKNQITNNVTRAFLVFGAAGGDNDLPTNGHWVALNWVNPTNAEVLVSKAGVVTTNAATITTSASPLGFGLWIDHKSMKLLLSNNQLTRYAKSGDYATTTAIPLDGPLAVTAQTLLAWLQAQLTEGESVGQVFLEPDGTHSDYETTVDAEGNESQVVTSTRAKLSAAVTAHAAAGSRSVVFSSEALPAELRDGLLAAWAVIEGMP